MKKVKIILAISVVAIIGFFVIKWLIVIDPPKGTANGMNFHQVTDLILQTQEDLRERKELQEKEESNSQDNLVKEGNASSQIAGTLPKPQISPTSQPSDKYLDREFWSLVNSGNSTKDTYTQLLKKHESKGGDIITYLKKICKNSASFQKFKKIPEIDRQKAKTLTEIDIDQN